MLLSDIKKHSLIIEHDQDDGGQGGRQLQAPPVSEEVAEHRQNHNPDLEEQVEHHAELGPVVVA